MGDKTDRFKSLYFIKINMADLGIWTKNADIQAKAGVNANATAKLTAATDVYVLNVEAFVNVATRYNWSDEYVDPGINADVLGILTEITSNLCAIYVIQSDMSGFTDATEAEDMINVLRDSALRNISILREQQAQDFIKDESP